MSHAKLFASLLVLSLLLAIILNAMVSEGMLVSSGSGGVVTGAILLCIGMGFFAAYIRPQAYVSKPFIFFCLSLSSPSSTKMALFYFVLLTAFGFLAIRDSVPFLAEAL